MTEPTDSRVGVRLPGALLDGARDALGLPECAMKSEIVRAALATVAGFDVDEHARRPWGGTAYRKEGAAA